MIYYSVYNSAVLEKKKTITSSDFPYQIKYQFI